MSSEDKLVHYYEQQALPVHERDCLICGGRRVFTKQEIEALTPDQRRLAGIKEPLENYYRCGGCNGTGKYGGAAKTWVAAMEHLVGGANEKAGKRQ